MAVARVPQALAERLGDDGTKGLLSLLASTKAEWTEGVLTSAVDRFERRLPESLATDRDDGRRFLMIKEGSRNEGQGATATIRVVLNWGGGVEGEVAGQIVGSWLVGSS